MLQKVDNLTNFAGIHIPRKLITWKLNLSKRKVLPPYLDSVGRYLGMATGATSEVTNGLLAKHNMTLQHWVVLTALWRQEGLSVSDIASYYGVNAPAASRIVGRMRDAGWITTQTDSNDKRATKVFLTDKTRKIAHLLDLYKGVNDIMLDGFSETDVTQLKELLARISKNGRGHIAELKADTND